MMEMTTAGSHADGQLLGEVFHRLVDVFLWQLFSDDRRHFVMNPRNPRAPSDNLNDR